MSLKPFSSSHRIGLYGGTFDPPHHGHVHVVLTALESRKVDEVWVIPAFCNPLRLNASIASGEHRLEMVKQAFAFCPQVKVCDIELKEELIYTIDTVKRLRDHTSNPFHLLLGSDCISSLNLWKDYQELLQLAPPYFIEREQVTKEEFVKQLDQLAISPSLHQTLLEHWIRAPILDISSTQIRRRLFQKFYCYHLAAESVLHYITTHRLYMSAIIDSKK